MTTLLADFEAYFNSLNLLEGFECGLDTLLDSSDEAVGIYEYSGSPSPAPIKTVLRSIQIVVRSTSVKVARAKSAELYKSLQTDDTIIQLTPERWATIALRQTPFKFKVDEKGRAYYAFNLGCNTYYE